jgi:hypothetical protein
MDSLHNELSAIIIIINCAVTAMGFGGPLREN